MWFPEVTHPSSLPPYLNCARRYPQGKGRVLFLRPWLTRIFFLPVPPLATNNCEYSFHLPIRFGAFNCFGIDPGPSGGRDCFCCSSPVHRAPVISPVWAGVGCRVRYPKLAPHDSLTHWVSAGGRKGTKGLPSPSPSFQPPSAKYGGRHTVTMIPGDGIGPELMLHVKSVFRYRTPRPTSPVGKVVPQAQPGGCPKNFGPEGQ